MTNEDILNKKIAVLEAEIDEFTVEISNAYEELHLIYSLTEELGVSIIEPNLLVAKILNKARELLKARCGFFMVFKEISLVKGIPLREEKQLILESHYGFSQKYLEKFDIYKPLRGLVGMALSAKEPIIKCDVIEEEAILGIKQCLCVPIHIKDEDIGVLCLGDKESGQPFYSYDAKLLFALATQLGAIFVNMRLYHRIEKLLLDTVGALVEAIEQKDPYTRGHSEGVANLTRIIANEMNFLKDEIMLFHIAAILHDIGKIGISKEILTKPTKLDKKEWKIITQHPEKSIRIVESISELRKIIPIIYHHHERYAGGGYPEGIFGEAIPVGSRIIALADSFDAMNSNRSYRQRMNIEEILLEIKKNNGTQFDPKVVDAFFSAFNNGKVKY